VKTNEREGTRAVLRNCRMSAYKSRQVLDLIRGKDVDLAADILANGDREAATVIGKLLASAVANAVHNDGLDAEDLFVSACYADEGSTLKRWRPRARGRATRIRKRTCHITIIVSRLPDERIARRRAKASAASSQRSRRVASSRRTTEDAPTVSEETTNDETTTSTVDEVSEAATSEATTSEATTTEASTVEASDTVAEGGTDAEGTDAEGTDAESTDADAGADDTNGDSAEEKG
jgi:large subunit ribosomal protein L22